MAMIWETVCLKTAVCVLLRHAERFAIEDGDVGLDVSLTEKGRRDARVWGAHHGEELRKIFSSPISRCADTAKCIVEGARFRQKVSISTRLGDPGPYVVDGRIAWKNWEHMGSAELNRRLMTTREELPGMVEPLTGARRLVDFMLMTADRNSGIYAYVTHDNIIAITIAQLLGIVAEYNGAGWPDYLQVSAWWRSGSKLICEWGCRLFELPLWRNGVWKCADMVSCADARPYLYL